MMKRSAVGRLSATAAALGMAYIGILATAGPAAAASNGQTVAVGTRYSDRIFICGHNQSDTLVCTDWIATPQTWAFVSGWWWKGEITITGEQLDAGQPVKRRAKCQVPVSYPSSLFWCETKNQL
ncbi:hypothetical protein [Streptomyces sp. NPDC001502]|uniref:hypothetical protein n=1 Tax=Streptomyces sp. NPDC001502 TaxID=3364578 RepID=UPI0036822488